MRIRRSIMATTGGTALFLLLAVRAHGAAPAGRYVVDTSADTVSDTKTHLTWQRRESADRLSDWSGAVTYCASFGGGWRLPTIKELQTLVDYSKPSETFDGSAFQFSNDVIMWSATKVADNTADYHYLISLARGHTVAYPSDYYLEYAVCVK